MSELFGKTELLPCPFCGGEALLKDDLEYFGARIICLECGASKVMYDFSKENSIKGVIEDWNKRVTKKMSEKNECPFCHDENRIRELEEQIETMKSCCICKKLNKCEVWREVLNDARFPIHNVNDAPCDEWELG